MVPDAAFAARLEELSRFIEVVTERFKAGEQAFASQLEVTQKEFALLQALAARGPMITRELGARFGVPVSTMTGLVDRMEKKGLLRRVPHRRDRRSIELEATPAGSLALKEHARTTDAVARAMLAALSEPDQRRLILLLRRIGAAIGGQAGRAVR